MTVKSEFSKNENKNVFFRYFKYTPKDYSKDKKYPLVIFLHGIGERGDNLENAKYGIIDRINNNEEFPFIFVAPQCPVDKHWGNYIESLDTFLDGIIDELSVDTDKIYLTGLSMGGMATWLWATARPDRFAAIIPVCGEGIACFAKRQLLNMPIWAFHGDIDSEIPAFESVKIISEINKSGGHAKLTIYNGVGHNCWNRAYSEPGLIEWMLAQKL